MLMWDLYPNWSATLFAQAQGGGGAGGAFSGIFVPMIVIMVLFYFMLVRPQKREQQRIREMQDSLKKNDHVVTTGGIYGTIVNAQQDSPFVTVRVDESTNTKLKVARSAISRVLSEDNSQDKTTKAD